MGRLIDSQKSKIRERAKMFGLKRGCEVMDESFYKFTQFIETLELFCLNIENYKHIDIELGGKKYKSKIYIRDFESLDYRELMNVKKYYISASIYVEGCEDEFYTIRHVAEKYIDEIYERWRTELNNLTSKYEKDGLSFITAFKLRPYWENDWFFELQFPRDESYYYMENGERKVLSRRHINYYLYGKYKNK